MNVRESVYVVCIYVCKYVYVCVSFVFVCLYHEYVCERKEAKRKIGDDDDITYENIGIEIHTAERIQHCVSKQICSGCTYRYMIVRMMRVNRVGWRCVLWRNRVVRSESL